MKNRHRYLSYFSRRKFNARFTRLKYRLWYSYFFLCYVIFRAYEVNLTDKSFVQLSIYAIGFTFMGWIFRSFVNNILLDYELNIRKKMILFLQSHYDNGVYKMIGQTDYYDTIWQILLEDDKKRIMVLSETFFGRVYMTAVTQTIIDELSSTVDDFGRYIIDMPDVATGEGIS